MVRVGFRLVGPLFKFGHIRARINVRGLGLGIWASVWSWARVINDSVSATAMFIVMVNN